MFIWWLFCNCDKIILIVGSKYILFGDVFESFKFIWVDNDGERWVDGERMLVFFYLCFGEGIWFIFKFCFFCLVFVFYCIDCKCVGKVVM